MKFKELHWDKLVLFQENLLNLGYNIFKIKYFYEEDQLQKLSHKIQNSETKVSVINDYQNAADEATTYLKAVTGFRNGDATLPKDEEYLNYILNYFYAKETDLLNFELADEEGFLEWLINKEYSK